MIHLDSKKESEAASATAKSVADDADLAADSVADAAVAAADVHLLFVQAVSAELASAMSLCRLLGRQPPIAAASPDASDAAKVLPPAVASGHHHGVLPLASSSDLGAVGSGTPSPLPSSAPPATLAEAILAFGSLLAGLTGGHLWADTWTDTLCAAQAKRLGPKAHASGRAMLLEICGSKTAMRRVRDSHHFRALYRRIALAASASAAGLAAVSDRQGPAERSAPLVAPAAATGPMAVLSLDYAAELALAAPLQQLIKVVTPTRWGTWRHFCADAAEGLVEATPPGLGSGPGASRGGATVEAADTDAAVEAPIRLLFRLSLDLSDPRLRSMAMRLVILSTLGLTALLFFLLLRGSAHRVT